MDTTRFLIGTNSVKSTKGTLGRSLANFTNMLTFLFIAEDWMNIQVYDNGYTAHGYYGIQFAARDPNGAYSKDIYQKVLELSHVYLIPYTASIIFKSAKYIIFFFSFI